MTNTEIETIQDIYYTTRGAGYTTMMLRASMYKPNCIIVAKDAKTRDWVEKQYDQLYIEIFVNRSWRRRMLTKILIFFDILQVPTKRPVFKTLRENLRGYNGPIFLDNSCFM